MEQPSFPAKKSSLPAVRQLQARIARQLVKSWVEELKKSQWNLPAKEQLVDRFIHIAGAHIADKHFGIHTILPQMQASCTSLHRKLKTLTGHSAHELIQMIQMQKALFLLQTTGLPVAEVALRVGFGSASHFTKIFRLYFDFLPSQAKVHAGNSNLPEGNEGL